MTISQPREHEAQATDYMRRRAECSHEADPDSIETVDGRRFASCLHCWTELVKDGDAWVEW